MTAVEWFAMVTGAWKYASKAQLEQAKKMEKEQIESAYKRGKKHKKPLKDSNPITKYFKSEEVDEVKYELGSCLNCEWNYDMCPHADECLKNTHPEEDAIL
jgi:hypothetical protein